MPRRPSDSACRVAEADAEEIERLFQPTISREGGLLARTLRLGAAGPTPEWLKQRSAEGTVSISGIDNSRCADSASPPPV